LVVLGEIIFFLLLFIIVEKNYLVNSKESHQIEGVPVVNQENEPWCVPGSLAIVLGFWRVKNVSVNEIGNEIDPEKDGIKHSEIIEYLNSLDIPVVEFDSTDSSFDEAFKELKKWIKEDHPVIVSMKLKKGGHSCVVVGFDATKIYTHDPNGFKESFSYDSFREYWKKPNGLVINPSDSDGDTLTDKVESEKFNTDPFNSDTDKDGLSDGEEVRKYKTDPLKQDTDGDFWSDKIEAEIMFDPLNSLLPNALSLLSVPVILILVYRRHSRIIKNEHEVMPNISREKKIKRIKIIY
jgi:predicted double-glycine peptidase